MPSSGKLRHVALVRTDVSEERSTSIIWVTRTGELETMLAVTSNQPMLRRNTIPSLVTLMMEELCSSETQTLTRATRHNIPEDDILHSHHRENLKSWNNFFLVFCKVPTTVIMYGTTNYSVPFCGL
jgi:hypothetical protein